MTHNYSSVQQSDPVNTHLCILFQILLAIAASYYWASLVAQLVKNLPAMQETQVRSLGRKNPPGEGKGNPLQYSCLVNPMVRGSGWATVCRVAKGQTLLSNFHIHKTLKYALCYTVNSCCLSILYVVMCIC